MVILVLLRSRGGEEIHPTEERAIRDRYLQFESDEVERNSSDTMIFFLRDDVCGERAPPTRK